MTTKKDASTDKAPQELPRVVPSMPGLLTLKDIATLAGVAMTTIRAYRYSKVAEMPDPTNRAGTVPLWDVDQIIEWLANRDFSRTLIEKQPDGSLQVVTPSDYLQRKAAGGIGQAKS